MRTVKISGSVNGVVSTGSYQNLRPGFTWEEEITDCQMTDDEIQERRKELFAMSLALLKDAEAQAILERIERERKDIRFRTHPETKEKVPSITSVISWDADFFVSPQELAQYASQGNITHAKVRDFIEEGVWKDAKDIDDVWADIVICKKGDLMLEADSGDFPAFLKKYPIAEMKNSEVVYLENTAGLPDFTGTPINWGKDAEEVLTVFDVKRTPDKVKNGMQLSQYCKGVGAKQGIVVVLNNKTEQGFSKPLIFDEKQLKGYDKMFQRKREEFRKRFGI